MKEGEQGPFSPKLRVRIKDNNSSPHGKFYRFLLPFSSKFSDLNFASYVHLRDAHSEPGLPVGRQTKSIMVFSEVKFSCGQAPTISNPESSCHMPNSRKRPKYHILGRTAHAWSFSGVGLLTCVKGARHLELEQ